METGVRGLQILWKKDRESAIVIVAELHELMLISSPDAELVAGLSKSF